MPAVNSSQTQLSSGVLMFAVLVLLLVPLWLLETVEQHGYPHTSSTCLCACAGELPSGLGKVCFTWERGSKVFTTSAEAVNPATRAVFWQQFLKQVCWHGV